MVVDRAALIAEDGRTGLAWCHGYRDAMDGWLRDLFQEADGGSGAAAALVAIGGYGRGDLCPFSDLDVILVHDRRASVAGLADRLWYPIWDAGFHLGHSVATVAQAVELASDDLDTATALLSARHIAGQEALTDELRQRAERQWTSQPKKWLTQLSIRVHERHANGHEVAFALEPDLKDGRGGLRDVHSLWWAQQAKDVLAAGDASVLEEAYATLLAARVALHRQAGRATNTLLLEDREAVAGALGSSPDELLAKIAEAGRTIAWRSDDTWRRVSLSLRGPLGRIGRRTRALAPGVELRDGEVQVAAEAASAPLGLLRIAHLAAAVGGALSRPALALLAERAEPVGPWTDEARQLFVDLLGCGRNAIGPIEALDQAGLWARVVLPEWEAVRARPQHNPYHRYTVDRHLLETMAAAARLAPSVERPDLLVVAALLHDIGKGFPGDHTEAGMEVVGAIAARMGFADDDVATLVAMVQHHLLLADVATRRDLDDPATATRVAALLERRDRLHLLAALTEADGRATGPSAWSPWRAELVATLVENVDHVFAAGEPRPRTDPVDLASLAIAENRITVDGDTVTVVTEDRPGAFSRVAGALALHGLEVRAAMALSTDTGRAVSRFVVEDPLRGRPPWDAVVPDVERALEGRLALAARIAERATRYRREVGSGGGGRVRVHFDDHASDDATVVDVHAPDAIGVLYRITRALADLDLDIRSAKVQTIGAEVIDAFYVRDRNGARIDDAERRQEITRAIRHALTVS